MTVQFSRRAVTALSEGPSVLVPRLVCARDESSVSEMWLIDLDDAQLRSGLGLTVEDIAVLRAGTRTT